MYINGRASWSNALTKEIITTYMALQGMAEIFLSIVKNIS